MASTAIEVEGATERFGETGAQAGADVVAETAKSWRGSVRTMPALSIAKIVVDGSDRVKGPDFYTSSHRPVRIMG